MVYFKTLLRGVGGSVISKILAVVNGSRPSHAATKHRRAKVEAGNRRSSGYLSRTCQMLTSLPLAGRC